MTWAIHRAELIRRFPSRSPLAKIGLWLVGVAGLALALQAIASLAGSDFSLLAGDGRGWMAAFLFGMLVVIVTRDHRPAADYGLAVGERWQRQLFRGVLIGGVFCLAYFLCAAWAGAVTINFQHVTVLRTLYAAVTKISAIPISVIELALFSGYLVSILRDRYPRVLAIVVASGLFGLTCALQCRTGIASPAAWKIGIGSFLTAVLVTSVRLRMGSLALPTGMLAGLAIARHVFHKTQLFRIGGDLEAVGWWIPANDFRQAPAMWIALGGLSAAALAVLHLRGERRPAATDAPIDRSLMQFLPFTNLMMFAPLDLWLPQLWDARFRIGAKQIPRTIAILVGSALNTILSLPERILAPLLIRHKVRDPLFIVGVHRSGTTHLHNMLALDPRFCTTLTSHIFNPAGFLTTSWLTTPLLAPLMNTRRPMDGVLFHMFAPQEEEFAIAGLCKQSPYWGYSLPQRIARHDRYIFFDDVPAAERSHWMRTFDYFLKKLTFWSRKTPLLKSPYNTARVGLFRELYPRAKFVHIVRHPYAVYPSNMKMADQGLAIFELQEPDPADCYKTRFLDHYAKQEESFYREAAKLPESDVVEVKYEDLVRDPLGEIRRIYATLQLEFSPAFQQKLEQYLAGVSEYQKNKFSPLPEDVQRQIDAKLGPLMERWGYREVKQSRAA
jgi:hypothetical protein